MEILFLPTTTTIDDLAFTKTGTSPPESSQIRWVQLKFLRSTIGEHRRSAH